MERLRNYILFSRWGPVILGSWAVFSAKADDSSIGSVDVFSPEILEIMAPAEGELPENFRLAENAGLMEVKGMIRNPGFITNRSETMALAERGALCSFAAVYEDNLGIGIIINGVYFRDEDDFESFWTDQKEKDLRIMGFRGEAPHGIWLVLIGCDPEREFDEVKGLEIKEGLEAYRRRLGLIPLFDGFESIPSPESW